MAEYLASIFGTEKDKVNCSFYFKIGACRHGDRCSRLHNKPTFSQTVAMLNIYRNPQNTAQSMEGVTSNVSDVEMQEHYDEFFEEVFTEMEEKYGEVEEMNVCDNLGDHLVGNVYVKFRKEEDAEKAMLDLNNRWFNGQPIHAELSPVTDFREACCHQYETGGCTRGGFCNFMHLKPISRDLRRQLYGHRRKRSERRRDSQKLEQMQPPQKKTLLSSVSAAAKDPAQETGSPAPGTEVERQNTITRGGAPETGNAPGGSEPQPGPPILLPLLNTHLSFFKVVLQDLL
uniref:U2 small nuclear RNA auxiliary factor 1 n=1 Tax=Oryzias latipes TaxID=8090 RepID=H2LYA0_ORYLA